MDKRKRKRLEERGWKVGTAQEFLGLSAEEVILIEMRLALGKAVKKRREISGLSQMSLAERMGSSQSRVAKIEAGDPKVTLDLMIRALVSLGASANDVARAIQVRL